jgi:RimJ/RimL family protein N-acetyltransferase
MKRNREKKQKPEREPKDKHKGWRKLHFGEELWLWRYGDPITIVSPDKTYKITQSELTGMTNDNIERAQWKGYFSITPSKIKHYINTRIRPMKLTLEPLRLKHLDDLMTWVNDPEHTVNMARLNEPVTRAQEGNWISKMMRSKTDFVFVIRNEEGKYLGNVGIHEIYWPAKRGRIGLFLKDRGQGIGPHVLRMIIEKAFNEMDLHKLWIINYARNERMAHIAHDLGFQQEGLMLDEYVDSHGNFRHMVRRCILKPNWERLCEKKLLPPPSN